MKLINNMMNNKNNNNYNIDPYIQSTFESMTKYLWKNTIWINRNTINQLLPELKKLFFRIFLDFLQKTLI